MPFFAGERLGPYEIMSSIGSGGMGEVWKARDTRLGRIVAIKQMISSHVSASSKTQFEQEARAIAALNHPHICQIHDVGPDYLVLEYIDGKALRGPLPVDEAVRLALQISSALAEAHRKGIIHRDLKPANILMTEAGSAKLLDFGIATLAASPDSVTRSVENTVMGTVAYMSPEQATGRPLDERSDIFSFGAVLYEMISGEQAFGGGSAAEVLSAILRDHPGRLIAPAGLIEIVMRCLRKAPDERFQAVTEISAALKSLSGKPAEPEPSIAVLPFANMSRDPDDEYFSDGLAEEILNALSHIPDLKVTARTSSFAFRGKEQDVTRIAGMLRVRTILEGSVRRAGNRIRVTAQLIDAADGYHLWSERYDRELADVFGVQDEIAGAIAGALQVKLTGRQENAPPPHEPELPAWEAFLKGRHQSYTYSPEAFVRAEDYFRQAIALDPQWAIPHSALGRQYMALGFFGLRPVSEMTPLARAEAHKALELLPSDPTAHALLGAIAASHDYDWKEAGEQFRLARASEPVPPDVHDAWALFYLLPLGRFEEAIAAHAAAIAQDPLNALWRARQAHTLLCAGMYERAITEARKALEFDDRNFSPHVMMAISYFLQGKTVEAREPAEEAFRIAPWNAWSAGFLAALLTQNGENGRAEELIATPGGMIPAARVLYHLFCGEIDAAMDWCERGIQLREPGVAMSAAARIFKPLRSNPRWPRLAAMMNLPETV